MSKSQHKSRGTMHRAPKLKLFSKYLATENVGQVTSTER
jgi:hypothetical protein